MATINRTIQRTALKRGCKPGLCGEQRVRRGASSECSRPRHRLISELGGEGRVPGTPPLAKAWDIPTECTYASDSTTGLVTLGCAQL